MKNKIVQVLTVAAGHFPNLFDYLPSSNSTTYDAITTRMEDEEKNTIRSHSFVFIIIQMRCRISERARKNEHRMRENQRRI